MISNSFTIRTLCAACMATPVVAAGAVPRERALYRFHSGHDGYWTAGNALAANAVGCGGTGFKCADAWLVGPDAARRVDLCVGKT